MARPSAPTVRGRAWRGPWAPRTLEGVVVDPHLAGLDAVVPAVHLEAVGGQAGGDRRVGAQVGQLRHDVLLDEQVEQLLVVGVGMCLGDRAAGRLGLLQPRLDARQAGQLARRGSSARIPPQSEWPQMMMWPTSRTDTAYSMVADTPP